MNPAQVWKDLRETYAQSCIDFLLPRAMQKWNLLKFSDFPNIHAYNAELQCIATDLKECDHGLICTDTQMILKILTTVPDYMSHIASFLFMQKDNMTYRDIFRELRKVESFVTLRKEIMAESSSDNMESQSFENDVDKSKRKNNRRKRRAERIQTRVHSCRGGNVQFLQRS